MTIGESLRSSSKRLTRTPAFSLALVFVLGLAMLAEFATFRLLASVNLQDLPVRDPDTLQQLVWRHLPPRDGMTRIQGAPGLDPLGLFSLPSFRRLATGGADANDSLAFAPTSFFPDASPLRLRGASLHVNRSVVSGSYFDVLGIRPAAGRLLGRPDDLPGSPPALVLSYNLWTRVWNRNPGIVGETAEVDGQITTIVGIAPAGFSGLRSGFRTDAWQPLATWSGLTPTMANMGAERTAETTDWLSIFTRRSPHADSAAPAPGDALSARIATPAELRQRGGVSFREGRRGVTVMARATGNQLWPIFDVALIAFLMACGSCACLFWARSTRRAGETAVRMVMGARRRVLFLEFGVDCLLVAGLAAVLASAVAVAVTKKMGDMVAGPVAPFGFAVSPLRSERAEVLLIFLSLVGAAALCSVAAGRAASRASLASLLSGAPESRPTSLGAHHPGIRWLSATQAMVSLLIVASGLLFVRTLRARQHDGPHFNLAGLIQFTVHPSDIGLQGGAGRQLLNQLLRRLRVLPTTEAASSAATPLLSNFRASAGIKLLDPEPPGHPEMVALNLVGPGYLGTIGAHILSGRDFLDTDDRSLARVALLSQAAADRLTPGGQVTGRRLTFSIPPVPETTFRVIGTFADLESEPGPGTVLILSSAAPRMMNYARSLGATFVLRSHANVSRAMAGVRKAVAALQPGLAVTDLGTVQQTLDDSQGSQRFAAWLGGGLSVLALALAALSTLGQSIADVSLRRREMGIRIAVGATRSRVVGLVTFSNAFASAAGLAVGAGITVLGSGILSHYFTDLPRPSGFEVTVATLALLSCAAVGALVPAIIEVARDPARALRLE